MRRCGCSVRAPAASRGSAATCDIAILPQDELPSGFFGELDAEIQESTIPYDVDLVDLRHADPALVAEVRREDVRWRD